MYRKNSSGWSKHIDFILLDLFCVQLAFYISYVMRQGDWNPYVIPIYRHMAIFIELENLTIIFLFEAYKNVLKRGYYKEAVASIKQSFMLLLVCSLYLITMQDGNDYSRVSLFIMGVVYGLLTYIIRILWKGLLHHRMKNGEDVS
ncbi:TPA: hypothetical protein ACGV5A_002243 [Enterococcus faecium]